MFRKCYLSVFSLSLILTLSFPLICQSKTYYWYDITVPYENYEGINKIVLGSIVNMLRDGEDAWSDEGLSRLKDGCGVCLSPWMTHAQG